MTTPPLALRKSRRERPLLVMSRSMAGRMRARLLTSIRVGQDRLRLHWRVLRRATAPRTTRARRRGAGRRLLGGQVFAQRFDLGHVLLVAGRINVRIHLRVRLQLLVLAREVEEPAVRAEEDVARVR